MNKIGLTSAQAHSGCYREKSLKVGWRLNAAVSWEATATVQYRTGGGEEVVRFCKRLAGRSKRYGSKSRAKKATWVFVLSNREGRSCPQQR